MSKRQAGAFTRFGRSRHSVIRAPAGEEFVEAPAVGGLDSQQPAGGAHAEDGVVDWRGDAAGDGHGHGKAEGEEATGIGGGTGEQTDNQEKAAGDLDDGGYYGQDLREGIWKKTHELMGVCGKMMPVAPTYPGAAIGPPGAEPIETEQEKAGSKGKPEIELGKGGAHTAFSFQISGICALVCGARWYKQGAPGWSGAASGRVPASDRQLGRRRSRPAGKPGCCGRHIDLADLAVGRFRSNDPEHPIVECREFAFDLQQLLVHGVEPIIDREGTDLSFEDFRFEDGLR